MGICSTILHVWAQACEHSRFACSFAITDPMLATVDGSARHSNALLWRSIVPLFSLTMPESRTAASLRADCYDDFRPHCILCYSTDGSTHLQDSWHNCCQGHPVVPLRSMPCSDAYRLYHSADASWDVWCQGGSVMLLRTAQCFRACRRCYSAEEGRDAFKTLKNQQIACKCAHLYSEWAAMELQEGNEARAVKQLRVGIREEAQPIRWARGCASGGNGMLLSA